MSPPVPHILLRGLLAALAVLLARLLARGLVAFGGLLAVGGVCFGGCFCFFLGHGAIGFYGLAVAGVGVGGLLAVWRIFVVGRLPIRRIGVAGFLPVLGVFIFDVRRCLAGLGESGGGGEKEREGAGDFNCVWHKNVGLVTGSLLPAG